MSVAVDATVVRYPMSGVHYAVRHQALALIENYAERMPTLLATDPFLRKRWAAVDAPCPALPERLTKAVWRISWQQAMLPNLLRKLDCSRLLGLSYTAPLRCPIPVILQIHDTIALREPKLCTRKNALHMRSLMPRNMAKAHTIITPSTQVATEVMNLSHRKVEDVKVVPMGVDEIFLADGAGEELPEKWEKLKPFILFVGNIEPKKGIDTLLAAYRLLDCAKAAKLVIVGREGWKCRWLVKELEAYSGPGEIHRLGYVERNELPSLYRHASVYVQPSVEEGFGLPVLEAMGLGTPVVHTDHPVLMETANGFGLDVPIGDARILAGVLGQVLDNAEGIRKEKAPAREWARTRTWGRWAQQLVEETGLWGE